MARTRGGVEDVLQGKDVMQGIFDGGRRKRTRAVAGVVGVRKFGVAHAKVGGSFFERELVPGARA